MFPKLMSVIILKMVSNFSPHGLKYSLWTLSIGRGRGFPMVVGKESRSAAGTGSREGQRGHSPLPSLGSKFQVLFKNGNDAGAIILKEYSCIVEEQLKIKSDTSWRYFLIVFFFFFMFDKRFASMHANNGR